MFLPEREKVSRVFDATLLPPSWRCQRGNSVAYLRRVRGPNRPEHHTARVGWGAVTPPLPPPRVALHPFKKEGAGAAWNSTKPVQGVTVHSPKQRLPPPSIRGVGIAVNYLPCPFLKGYRPEEAVQDPTAAGDMMSP